MSSFDDAVSQINKQYGKMSIIRGDSSDKIDIEVIPTGSLLLDEALGVGGYPRGRIIEIYGPEMSGKSTLSLHACANAQKFGKVVFIDTEHSLDLRYAKGIGVDTDKLYISQPDCGEEALEIADTVVRSGECILIVIDSVAALVPRAELEGDMGQSHMGLQARLMSQALRKLTGIASKANTTIIFTNQIRNKIGIMFGSPETTTGGNALKFYATIRLDVRRRDKVKKEEDIVGNKIGIKVVKNKVAAPFKEIETFISYGIGIDRAQELLTYHIKKGTIVKSGAWFVYKEHKIQGAEAIVEFVRENINEFEGEDLV